MNETTKKIEELRDEIERLEYEIRELERKNSNFYIGVYVIGDGDYWDEYYTRLGFISEEQAKNWVVEQEDDENVYSAKYFEVTEEIYNKYWDWYCLDKLQKSINRYNTAIDNLEGVDSFEDSINKAITDLAEKLEIKYLSFMHPVND